MLERYKTITKRLIGGEVMDITYKIPSALEAERHIKRDVQNSTIVKAFVTNVECTGEDFTDVKTADDLLNLPGGSRLVAEVALDIVSATILGDEEKN